MTNLTGSRSFSYSVFSFVTDEIRGTSIPVGIAIWSSAPDQVRVKLATDTDNVKGLKQSSYPYIRLAEVQVEQWVKERRLPYGASDLTPSSDAWWRHLGKIMVHKVRISDPSPIDCRNPDDELELLYEAVVGPQYEQKTKTARIDRVINASLRGLTRRLERGSVPGFMGRPVPVKGFKASGDRLFVIEGVNLAAADAEDDADALVSRLQRISEAGLTASDRQVVAFVGYLASPSGLNGERALVEWINTKAGARTFDLVREQDRFAEDVEQEIASLEGRFPRR